jgi:hypothetical protein
MNAEKTEVMIMEGGNVSQPIPKDAYLHRITGQGKSWSEKSREKISCSLCGAIVSQCGTMQHQLTKKCINNTKHLIPMAVTPILQQPDEDR